MSGRSNQHLENDAEQKIQGHLLRLNVSRVFIASIVVFVFQLIHLFDPRHNEYLFVRDGAIVICVVAVVFGIFAFKMKDCKRTKDVVCRRFYRVFWVFFSISMLPFFKLDVQVTDVPINFIIYAFMIVTIPVFSTLDIAWFFPTAGIYLCVAAMYFGARPFFLLEIVTMMAGAAFATYYLNKGFIDIIRKLQVDSDTDSLTEICNRRAGMERMQRTMAICKRAGLCCAVFMIDIDFFKHYNDQFGHLAGDEALRAIAQCIQGQYSRASDVVCRYGGEEFAVLALAHDEKNALDQAEILLRKVEQLSLPAANQAVSPYLTISIGFSMFRPDEAKMTGDGETLTQVLDLADSHLYRAKQAGRNRVCYRSDATAEH